MSNLTLMGQLWSHAFNSKVGWVYPATCLSKNFIIHTCTATLQLSAIGRWAAPLHCLDVFLTQRYLCSAILSKCEWVIRFSLTNLQCVTSILIPDFSCSDVKAFRQPAGSNSHQLSCHQRNDAGECRGLLQSSFTNTASSGLSVSPAEMCRAFQTEDKVTY